MGAAWDRGADRGIENLLCIASIMWKLITILAQHMNQLPLLLSTLKDWPWKAVDFHTTAMKSPPAP